MLFFCHMIIPQHIYEIHCVPNFKTTIRRFQTGLGVRAGGIATALA